MKCTRNAVNIFHCTGKLCMNNKGNTMFKSHHLNRNYEQLWVKIGHVSFLSCCSKILALAVASR